MYVGSVVLHIAQISIRKYQYNVFDQKMIIVSAILNNEFVTNSVILRLYDSNQGALKSDCDHL